jgi:hypothetical protein
MSIDGTITVTHGVGACRPCQYLSILGNRLAAQQTAYSRLPDPNAFQEKFYWCTVTPIKIRTFERAACVFVYITHGGRLGLEVPASLFG